MIQLLAIHLGNIQRTTVQSMIVPTAVSKNVSKSSGNNVQPFYQLQVREIRKQAELMVLFDHLQQCNENTETISWHFISVIRKSSWYNSETIICMYDQKKVEQQSLGLTAIAELLLLTKDRNELYDASLLSVFLRIIYPQLLI